MADGALRWCFMGPQCLHYECLLACLNCPLKTVGPAVINKWQGGWPSSGAGSGLMVSTGPGPVRVSGQSCRALGAASQHPRSLSSHLPLGEGDPVRGGLHGQTPGTGCRAGEVQWCWPGLLPRGSGVQTCSRADEPGARPPARHTESVSLAGPQPAARGDPGAEICVPGVQSAPSDCRWALWPPAAAPGAAGLDSHGPPDPSGSAATCPHASRPCGCGSAAPALPPPLLAGCLASK